MVFGHSCQITTFPDPRGKVGQGRASCKRSVRFPVLELGGEERLSSPSTFPHGLRLSCSRHTAEALALQRRGFCNLPNDQMVLCMSSLQKFKPACFCLQRRGERTAGHLPSIENRSEVIPWWFSPNPSSKQSHPLKDFHSSWALPRASQSHTQFCSSERHPGPCWLGCRLTTLLQLGLQGDCAGPLLSPHKNIMAL